MATYTAKVNTPFGRVEVQHDGKTPEFQIIEEALRIGRERQNLSQLNSSLSPEELVVQKADEPPVKVEEDDEENSYREDLVNVIGRTGAGASNLAQDIVNGVAKLVNFQGGKEVIDDDFLKRANSSFVDSVASLVGGVDPKKVMTEEGDFEELQTVAGQVGQLVPYVAGGVGVSRGLATLAPKLPLLFNGILSGVAIDNLLYREEDGNLAKGLADAEYLEGTAQDILEFMATDEDDSALEQRMKVILESAILGGAAEGIIKSVKGVSNFVLPSAKSISDQASAMMDYLKTARENVNIRSKDIHSDLSFSETPEGIAQVEMQASKPLQRYKNKMFTSRGYWTPKAYNLFRGKEYGERQLVAEATNIANRLTMSLKKMPVDTVPEEKINEFLTEILSFSTDFYNKLITRGELEERVIVRAGQMKIPEEAALELLNARELIDTLSSRLANSSIPNPEFKDEILSNVGEYIRRSYRMFEDFGFKPDENLKHDVVEQLRATNLANGMDETEAYEKALGQVNKILNARTDFAGLDYFSKGVRVNTEILTGKKDIDVQIRQLMGEITSPTENIVLTIGKMAKLVENNKFADNFFSLGYNKYIFDEPITRNGVTYDTPISGTNSKLDGVSVKIDGEQKTKPYYTTPELAEALAGRQATFGLFDHSFFRGLGAIKGASQSMKTVASHITHARNILGGAQFGLANGINPFSDSVNTFRTLVNNAKNQGDEGLDALYEKYLNLGIINTNVRVNEFRQLINEGAEIQSFDQLGGMFKRLDFYGSKKITDPVAGALSKGYKAAEKIYMGVDDFYKINAFNKELDTLRKALPDESIDVLEERAAQIVQDTFPNYDKVPNGIKAFRNLPIGSFVSFPAEIVRTSYHIVKQAREEIATGNPVLVKRGKQRLAGFATSMSAWQGMAITGGYLAGLGTEEQEAVQKLSHTPWSKATRIPFRTDDGKLFVADTQFLDSYSVLKEPIMEAFHRIQSGQLKDEAADKYLIDAFTDSMFSMIKPYTDEAIFSKAIGDIYFAIKNENGRTPEGKQLFPEDEHPLVKLTNGLAHVGQSFLPGTVDSTYRALVQADVTTIGERFFDAEPAKTASTGSQRFDRRSELAANFTGVKFTPLNVTDRLYFATQDFKFKPKTYKSEKPNFDKPTEDVVEAVTDNLASAYSDQQDLYTVVQESIKLVGRAETIRTMIDAGLGFNATRAIINNRFYDTDWEEQNAERFFKTNEDSEVIDALKDIKAKQLQYMRTPLIRVDEESIDARNERDRLTRGGEVKNVPQVPVEPDERIDKMTGLPYNQQAGTAFMDEEDRAGLTRRFAVAKGGKVDKKKMACNKPRRTPNHPKKSHVVKACKDGKEKIIRFGQQGAKTAGKPKAGESKRMKAKRKSFKARHRKNIKRGNMSAAYWADKVKW